MQKHNTENSVFFVRRLFDETSRFGPVLLAIVAVLTDQAGKR
jgi:hypothetical protein